MNKSKLWSAFLSVGISALAVPAFVQSQTRGSRSSPGSGMSSGAAGSSRTMESPSLRSSASRETGMPSSPGSTHPGTSTMGSPATPGHSTGMSAAADQAKTEADRTLNQNIRHALKADSALGMSAKNVHFNTDNGKVTLSGTVPTEKHKKVIEVKVEKMTGVKDVDNQLQTAPATSTSSAAGSMGATSSAKPSGSDTMGSASAGR
jgi:hypothetical protein